MNDEVDNVIFGKFVIAQCEKTSKIIFVKLSAITTIEHLHSIFQGDKVDDCYFSTHKKDKYYTVISALALIEKINGIQNHVD